MSRTIRVPAPPAGFQLANNALTKQEEDALVNHLCELPFKEFEFQGYLGKRRVVSFGWRYDFGDYSLRETQPIPDFLVPVRARAAEFAGIKAEEFAHTLVTEYKAGTTIGWHRDRNVFGDVVGISLLSNCTFRFRRRSAKAWERHSVLLEPRSMYLLRGPARDDWEHSIPPVDELRYSITFRSLRTDGAVSQTAHAKEAPDAGTPDETQQLSLDF